MCESARKNTPNTVTEINTDTHMKTVKFHTQDTAHAQEPEL